MMTSSTMLISLTTVRLGILQDKDTLQEPMTEKNSRENSTERLPMLIFLKAFVSTFPFACSFAFGENKLMEGSNKILSLIARDESQHLVITQNILNKWRDGDDPEMEEIAREEKGFVTEMFKKTVDEEKMWGKLSVQRR